MPAKGKSEKLPSNIVSMLPGLPYPMTLGQISWAENFEQSPSGQLTYEGMQEVEASFVCNLYLNKPRVVLYGIVFETKRVSYDRVPGEVEEADLSTYKVVVSIEGKNADSLITSGVAVKAKKTNPTQFRFATGSQLFTKSQIIADGANEISFDGTEYNEAELTWGEDEQVEDDEVPSPPRSVFKLKEPVIDTIEEYSENYISPPANTTVLQDDTKENFDESGEKKIYKKTTRVNGEPSAEIVETWGFAYLWKDIYNEEKGKPYSESPGNFWKRVETRTTDYIYTRTLPVQYRIRVSDGGKPVRVIIHPDYAKLGNISGGVGELEYRSNAEFLTQISTRGWKLARLKKEDDSRNSSDPEDVYTTSGAFAFKQIPLTAKTINVLAVVKKAGELTAGISPPFSVEFSDYESLEPRLKRMVPKTSTTIDGRVAILFPDPNYVEPLYVKAELSASSSFLGMDDPDGEEEDEDNAGEGAKTPKRARLTTGEESRNEVERTIHSAERYSERSTEYSSQDPGFDNAIEKIYFREMLGSPPSPQSRIQPYEKVEVNLLKIVNKRSQTKYLLSTAGAVSAKVDKGGAINIPEASSFTEALAAVQVTFRKESMSNSRSQKVLAGFHPSLKPGQPAISEKDLFASQGAWRITSVGHNLEYKGIVDGLGLLVLTPGTTVTLGLDKAKGITVATRTDPSGGDGDRKSDPRVSIQVSGEGLEPQDVLLDLPSRRTK